MVYDKLEIRFELGKNHNFKYYFQDKVGYWFIAHNKPELNKKEDDWDYDNIEDEYIYVAKGIPPKNWKRISTILFSHIVLDVKIPYWATYLTLDKQGAYKVHNAKPKSMYKGEYWRTNPGEDLTKPKEVSDYVADALHLSYGRRHEPKIWELEWYIA